MREAAPPAYFRLWLASCQVNRLRRLRRRDSTQRSDTVREMEAADWASLGDPELLERRISKLGLRLDGEFAISVLGGGTRSSVMMPIPATTHAPLIGNHQPRR